MFDALHSIITAPVRVAAAVQSRINGMVLLLAVLLLAASGSSAYFYREFSIVRDDPSVIVKRETAALAAAVGLLIELPSAETPTVATVVDPEKLKGQAFFHRAKKGDKILIYSGAGKAYLYDPTARKLVDVTSLDTAAVSANGATESAEQ